MIRIEMNLSGEHFTPRASITDDGQDDGFDTQIQVMDENGETTSARLSKTELDTLIDALRRRRAYLRA